jgi:hypothetical protein
MQIFSFEENGGVQYIVHLEVRRLGQYEEREGHGRDYSGRAYSY